MPSPLGGRDLFGGIFALLFGAFLGLALLKFPNPPIMENLVVRPTNAFEWALSAWPIEIAYWLLGFVAVVGLVAGPKRPNSPKWLLVLPAAWLAWQFISGTQTLSSELTKPTLRHFTTCVVCFYLGAFCLRRDRLAFGFWLMLIVAFGFVIADGFLQHFGGLAATREHYWAYVYPTQTNVAPEFIKKMNSDRIFSTLFYPNALAGALLLILPVSMAVIWRDLTRLTPAARGFLAVLLGCGGLACLFWSGSKGGWLLMLAVGVLAVLFAPVPRKLKVGIITCVAVAGLAGFALKYAGYFERKATSVSARFDYWRAAVHTVRTRPAFGTGPGTFAIAYLQVKRPESEMARLAHNDYLQQASDSGVLGFATYTAFIVGALLSGRPRTNNGGTDLIRLAIWLGLLGWGAQGLLEFGLYVPALAWCAFAIMGTFVAQGPELPKPSQSASFERSFGPVRPPSSPRLSDFSR
jgi:O-antigen ligase